MHRRIIERVRPARDTQETRRLLERFFPHARDFFKVLARRKSALIITILDDAVRHGTAKSRNVFAQLLGSEVDIHTHAIDAAFNHFFERELELALIDVVLILTHADGLGIDLDKFGQGVLQASRYGNGPADGQVEIGEFPLGDFRRAVYAGPRFIHGDRDRAFLGRQAFKGIMYKIAGFPSGGPVSDCHKRDGVF